MGRYEGTGRSLSLKLVQQLRQQVSTYGGSVKEARLAANMAKTGASNAVTGVSLFKSIQNSMDKPTHDIEKWQTDIH